MNTDDSFRDRMRTGPTEDGSPVHEMRMDSIARDLFSGVNDDTQLIPQEKLESKSAIEHGQKAIAKIKKIKLSKIPKAAPLAQEKISPLHAVHPNATESFAKFRPRATYSLQTKSPKTKPRLLKGATAFIGLKAKRARKIGSNTYHLFSQAPRIKWVGVGLLAATILPLALHSPRKTTTQTDVGTSTTGVLKDSITKPPFQVAAPKKDLHSGQVAYDSTKGVAVYSIKLKDRNLVVSQQLLPEGFKSDPTSRLKTLAETIYAKDAIAGKNSTAYLGTSIKGPQTLVFVTNELLVFIKSDGKIDNDQWRTLLDSF